MNKFYKLNVSFKPWWCEHFLDVYPSKHIETILEEEYRWEDYYEEDVYPPYVYWWKEIKNVQYTQDYVYLEETEPNIPLYIKYITDEKVYYYYLYSKDKLTTINKNGKSLYSCVYFIDKYMTIYFDKLQILFKKNPMVKFNRKYCVPWLKIDDTHYEFNFVKQKELSSYINDTNTELVRNEIFSINENNLYQQLGVDSIPSTLKWLKYPCNTGRYRYAVLKSSALSNVNNNKITPINVKQTIIIIPIKDDNTLNQISNVDLSSKIENKIVLSESNFIGIFECDLPYSYLYGLYLKDTENIKFTQDSSNIYYFEFPLNYYNKNILINYLKYDKGFYGKLKYIFQNTDKVIPDTEIALLAPQYYREVYDNGNGNITNDLSKFIFKWSTEQPLEFNLYITLQFNSDLGIAYNYGENTNTQLASYDNTNTQISNVSIPIGLVGSAAAQYFANNINTSLTSIQNRKLDQEQALRNVDFDSSKLIIQSTNNTVNNGINFFKSLFTGNIGGVINSAVNIGTTWAQYANKTAQMNFNYQQDQIRANRELTAKINNIYSSPNINLSNPFLKGVIPNSKDTDNNFQLFKHYAYELHPYDKKLIFAKLLDEGYIYNCVDNLNNFIVRKYMNILNIDPYMHYSHLLSILKENDKTLFNSPKDYDDFFIWLAKPKKIYNTNTLINVLDWEEGDYVNNTLIENIPKPLITTKMNINDLNINLPKWLPNYSFDLSFWKTKALEEIKEINPHLPNDIWQYLEIDINKDGESKLKVYMDNNQYTGEILFKCKYWMYRYIIAKGDEFKYVDSYIFTLKKEKIWYIDIACLTLHKGAEEWYVSIPISREVLAEVNSLNIRYTTRNLNYLFQYLKINYTYVFPVGVYIETVYLRGFDPNQTSYQFVPDTRPKPKIISSLILRDDTTESVVAREINLDAIKLSKK